MPVAPTPLHGCRWSCSSGRRSCDSRCRSSGDLLPDHRTLADLLELALRLVGLLAGILEIARLDYEAHAVERHAASSRSYSLTASSIRMRSWLESERRWAAA